MTVLNFPADTSQSPYEENGIIYVWDGQAWVTDGSADAALWELDGSEIKPKDDSYTLTVDGTVKTTGNGAFWASSPDAPGPSITAWQTSGVFNGAQKITSAQYSNGSFLIGGDLDQGVGNNIPNISLIEDGTAEFAGSVTVGDYRPFSFTPTGEGVGVFDSGVIELVRYNSGNVGEVFRVYNTTGTDIAPDTDPTVEIRNDGSAEFSGTLAEDSGNRLRVNAVVRGSWTHVGGYNVATDANVWNIGANGTASFVSVRSAAVVLEIESDNPANYTVEGEYTGPTLDVKERVMNLISRLDAIEANEVIDDATDSSLLQLVASASARLDSIEARLTAAGI